MMVCCDMWLLFCSEEVARESKIYSYGKSFNGFVARLLPGEVERISSTYIVEINTEIFNFQDCCYYHFLNIVYILAWTCR